MAELEVLNKNIETLSSNIDKLTNKLNNVSSSTDKAAHSNIEMNTSMVVMNQAMTNLGGAIPGVVSAWQSYKTIQQQVNIACEAFALNPVGATIELIALAIGAIIMIMDKFKDRIAESEDQTNRWNEATAALEPILSALNKALDFLVDGLIKYVEWTIKGWENIIKFGEAITDFLGLTESGYSKATEQAKKYAQLEADLNKEERKIIKERAESDKKQGELREQIAQAEGEAKLKLLEDLKEEIKLQTVAEIAINKKRIALMKYKQSLSESSAAEKEELAKLEAETAKLQADQANRLARIEKQIKSTNERISNDAKKTSENVKKASDDAAKAAEEATKRYLKQRDSLLSSENKIYSNNQKLIDAERKLEDERLKLTNTSESAINIIRKQRLDDDIKNEQAHYEERKRLLEETLENQNLSFDDARKYREELGNLETEHQINLYKQQTEEYKIQVDEQKRLREELAESGETQKELERQAQEEQDEADQERLDRMNEALEYTADLIVTQFDKLSKPEQLVIDSLLKLEDIWINMPKSATKAQKAMTMVSTALKSATSIVNSYMDAKQQQIQADLDAGKITEEEAKKQFEKTKKVQIAMATISMFQGIAEAIANAFQLPPLIAPIIAGINSAMVLTAGMMQIANIKKSTIESPGDSTGTGVTGSGITDTYQNFGASASPLLNEDFDLANMSSRTVMADQGEQRVYILESDIQESNKRVEVRESSTTF